MQYNTKQPDTIQYKTLQYNTIQYKQHTEQMIINKVYILCLVSDAGHPLGKPAGGYGLAEILLLQRHSGDHSRQTITP